MAAQRRAGAVEPGPQQGRALLQCAVHAIQDGRWDDLTHLLQSHAPALQAARLRLENQALERHAARKAAALQAEASADSDPPPAAATAAAARRKAVQARPGGEAAAVSVACQEPVSPMLALGRGLCAVGRWADQAPWLAILLVQLVVLASYGAALAYEGYKMDDTVAISRNPNVVADEVTLAEIMRRDFWGLPMHGAGWTNKSFRPLTTWTFRLNYLLHGLESSGFFIANVFLHCVASLLVGQTAMSVAGLSGSWAAIASLFFGVHPVHTENVLYLVGRADVLATIFGALALNMYAALYCPPPLLAVAAADEEAAPRKGWASNPAWLVFPIGLVVASGLCKETGFTLFALFLLMELLDFVDLRSLVARTGQRIPPRQWRRTRLRVILLGVATVFVFIARYRHTGGTSLNMSPQDNPISFESSKLTRMLSYAYLHGVYMRLLCWPQFLCYDYSMDAIPSVTTPLDCRLLLPCAGYVGLFGVVTVALRAPKRYRRSGLMSLAILVVSFFPASNILFPVGTVIGERLLYTPSVGFCLFVVAWLHRGFSGRPRPQTRQSDASAAHGVGRRNGKATSNGRANGRVQQVVEEAAPVPRQLRRLVLCFGVGSAVTAALVVRTLLRVQDWESSDTLFLHDGRIQPTSSKVQFNLGITHMQNQDWDAAVEALLRCAWADPLSSLPFYRIGQIEILRGRFETAEHYLAAAIDKFGASMMVRDEEVFHDLALAMFQNGKVEQAETRLRVALQLNPEFAKGWNNLACCMINRDIYDSTRALRKAVSLAPENPQYWANLALLAQHTGDPATASSAWRRATELWPAMPEPQDCTWEFAPAG